MVSPASRITGIAGSETQSYGYDALDRLMSITAPGSTQTYSYDPNGNRLTKTLGSQTTSYSYVPGSNRLESRTQATTQSYSYDPAGNLTDDGAHTFTYDARGRMVQAMTGALTTSFRYNGLGQRVSKTASGSSTVSRRFVYDESGHLIGEYDGSGTPIQNTVYLGDLPIAVLSGTDDIHYVHADQISTPRVITDSQGAVVWRWESDPFGVGTRDQDPDGDGLAFTYNPSFPGQYFDQETGLHYNYFRDYDPTIGRYIQSDPIGLAGGLNTYAYVGNNPISFVDPLGLAPGSQRVQPTVPGPPTDVFFPGTPTNRAFVDTTIRALNWLFGDDALGGDTSREAKAKEIKNKCIEECSPILERPKRYPGDDSPTWDFHKCVNECMERERKDCR